MLEQIPKAEDQKKKAKLEYEEGNGEWKSTVG